MFHRDYGMVLSHPDDDDRAVNQRVEEEGGRRSTRRGRRQRPAWTPSPQRDPPPSPEQVSQWRDSPREAITPSPPFGHDRRTHPPHRHPSQRPQATPASKNSSSYSTPVSRPDPGSESGNRSAGSTHPSKLVKLLEKKLKSRSPSPRTRGFLQKFNNLLSPEDKEENSDEPDNLLNRSDENAGGSVSLENSIGAGSTKSTEIKAAKSEGKSSSRLGGEVMNQWLGKSPSSFADSSGHSESHGSPVSERLKLRQSSLQRRNDTGSVNPRLELDTSPDPQSRGKPRYFGEHGKSTTFPSQATRTSHGNVTDLSSSMRSENSANSEKENVGNYQRVRFVPNSSHLQRSTNSRKNGGQIPGALLNHTKAANTDVEQERAQIVPTQAPEVSLPEVFENQNSSESFPRSFHDWSDTSTSAPQQVTHRDNLAYLHPSSPPRVHQPNDISSASPIARLRRSKDQPILPRDLHSDISSEVTAITRPSRILVHDSVADMDHSATLGAEKDASSSANDVAGIETGSFLHQLAGNLSDHEWHDASPSLFNPSTDVDDDEDSEEDLESVTSSVAIRAMVSDLTGIPPNLDTSPRRSKRLSRRRKRDHSGILERSMAKSTPIAEEAVGGEDMTPPARSLSPTPDIDYDSSSTTSSAAIREVVSDLVPLATDLKQRSRSSSKSNSPRGSPSKKKTENDGTEHRSSPSSTNVTSPEELESSLLAPIVLTQQMNQVSESQVKVNEEVSLDATNMSSLELSNIPPHESSVDVSQTSRKSLRSLNSGSTDSSVDEGHLDRMNAFAGEHVNHGDYDAALEIYLQILEMNIKYYGSESPSVAATHHNIGVVYAKEAAAVGSVEPVDQSKKSEAELLALLSFQNAARIARDSLSDDHPNVAVSLMRVGYLLLLQNQFNSALTTFQEALRIRMEHYGRKHSLVAKVYNNLGVVHLQLSNFAEGKVNFQRALDIHRSILTTAYKAEGVRDTGASTTPGAGEIARARMDVSDTLCNIGSLCLDWIEKQGEQTASRTFEHNRALEAESAFAEALAIRTALLGPDHLLVEKTEALHNMASSFPLPYDEQKDRSSSGAMGARGRGSMLSPQNPSASSQLPHPIARGGRDYITSPYIRRNNTVSDLNYDAQNPAETQIAVSSGSDDTDDDGSLSSIQGTEYKIGTRGSHRVNDPLDAVDSQNRKFGKAHNRSDTSFGSHKSTTRVLLTPQFIPKKAQTKSNTPALTPSTCSDTNSLGSLSHDWRGMGNTSTALTYRPSQRSPISPVPAPSDAASAMTSRARGGRSSYQKYDDEESCMLGDEDGLGKRKKKMETPQRNIIVMRPHGQGWSLERPTLTRAGSSRESQMPPKASVEDINMDIPDEPSTAVVKMIQEKPQPAVERSESRGALPTLREGERNTHGLPVVNSRSDDGLHVPVPATKDTSENTASAGGKEEDDEGLVPPPIDKRRSRGLTHGVNVPLSKMLERPEDYLCEIHESAAHSLKRNDSPEALRIFTALLEFYRKRHGELHMNVGSAHHNVGVVYLRAGRHREALDAFQRAVRVRKGALGRENPDVAVSLVKVGISHLLLSEFDQALLAFRNALSVRRRALGPLHPSTARVYNNIGCVHVEFNEIKEARRAFEAALDVQRNALCDEPDDGPLMFGAATTLCNLGYLYRFRNMHKKTILVLAEAISLQESVLGEEHPTVLTTFDGLAEAQAKSGAFAEALQSYRQILERFRRGSADVIRSPQDRKKKRAEGIVLFKMSQLHGRQNDGEAALARLIEARKVVQEALVTNDGKEDDDALERRIEHEIQKVQQLLEQTTFEWV